MSKKTILLVDDDVLIRQTLKTVLQTSCDYEVIEAPSGASAIAILSSEKPHINAAVLDLMMTGHGGSVGNYLKKTPEYSDTLIIYYSGLDKKQFDNKILEGALYVHKESGSTQQIVSLLEKNL